ncbi:MAG: SdrD B-like domain-containing protein [Clostridium sp.]
MAATITGIVFDDLNNNTIYTPGEPGIPNTIITLYDGSSCTTTTTDSNGNYSFDITTAGTYIVYETCESPNACPPTKCVQPTGYTCSNTKRKGTVVVTSAQITGNTKITGPNFGHSKDTYIPCSPVGLQISDGSLYKINMITGTPTKVGVPGTGNALAYEGNSEKLFYIRGSNVLRINGDMTTTDLGPYFGSIIATCDNLGRMLMLSGGN